VPYVAIEATPTKPGILAVAEIVDLSGRIVAATDLIEGPSGKAETVVGVGSRGVYISGPDGSLSRLQLDGRRHPLASAPPQASEDLAGLAESPDGSRWAYSMVSFSPAGTDLSATSRIFIGAEATTPVLAATLTRPNFANGHPAGGYRVLRWDAAGLLLGTDPTGVGGAGPFIGETYTRGSVVRMDPQTGTVSSPFPSGCGFMDVAGDGSVACRTSTGFEVVRPDGSSATATVTVATPGGASVRGGYGGLAFLRGSTSLLYSVANPAGGGDASAPGWTDTMYTGQVVGSAITGHAVASTRTNTNENGHAWADVIDPNRVAVIDGAGVGAIAVVLTLSTGDESRLASAHSIDGVIQAPA
jgi:hypothetical protein